MIRISPFRYLIILPILDILPWWHARDYGLVAANPFGQHDFEGKPEGIGKMELKLGESVTFFYRFLFHLGDPTKSEVSKKYLEWSKRKT
jgi:hypothetical protein